MRIRGPGAVLIAALLLGAAPADAQKLPTYRSPAFKGTAKAPKTAPATPPTPVPLAPDGLHPDVLVDEAGTAHIVYAVGRGDQADAAVYCRLKRGASSCDSTATLAPAKTYGEFDSPAYDIDNGGPEIVRVGDQLVILSYRYPTGFTRPDGDGSGGVVQWVSDDGGTTWTGGVLAARNDMNGDAIAFGPPDAPRIATIAHTGPCGACVQQIRGGTYDGSSANLGDEGGNRNYYANLTLDNGVPTAVFGDPVTTTFVRRWNGVDPFTSTANWTPSVAIPGTDPWIAGGPAGLQVLNHEPYKPFVLRKLIGTSVGAPTQVTPTAHEAVFGRVEQDAAGRILTAWENRRDVPKGDPAGAYMRVANPGSALGSQRLMLPGAAVGQMELAGADDGGGFMIANKTGGITSAGEIVALGYGKRSPTGKPGIANIAGGGDPSITQTCQETNFGSVKVTASEGTGCFLRGTGSLSNVRVSEGEVDLNGLKIVPDANVKVVIDPKKRQIFTTGAARVMLVGGSVSVTLWHGKVEIALPEPGVGKTLASFDTSKFPVNLLGFGLRGKIDVILTDKGVRVPISLALPPYLGDVRGQAELLVSTQKGLELTSLHVHAGNITLGPLLIEYFDLDYRGEGNVWNGKGRLVFPAGGALDGEVEFADGAFRKGSLGLDFPPPGVVVGPAVYLTRIGGTFGLDPTTIGAEARIAAGASVNGVAPISVLGRFDGTFPKNGPFTLQMSGSVSVLLIQLAQGSFRFISDGYADFKGQVGLDLEVLSLNGAVNGFVDGANGSWGTSAEVSLCVDLEFGPFKFPCISGDFAMGPVGMAACASADLPEPVGRVSGGIELPWKDVSGAELLNPIAAVATFASHLRTPCNTGPYKKSPRARAAQAGAPASIAVPGGLPTATIALTGAGGAPDVDVSPALPPGSYVARSAKGATTYVVLKRPAAGTYTFTPKAGTPNIAAIAQSSGYTRAGVSGSVRRAGSRRAISYRVANGGNGQTVKFIEQGAFGTHIVGSARGTRGTLRFTPTDGRGGRRTVYALVEHDGLVSDRIAIGSFVAPAPRAPGRIRRVRVTRRGSSATITWTSARNARRYHAVVRGTHGLRRQFVVRGRRVRLTRLAPGDRISASVRGLSRTGRRGPATRSR